MNQEKSELRLASARFKGLDWMGRSRGFDPTFDDEEGKTPKLVSVVSPMSVLFRARKEFWPERSYRPVH